MDSFCFSFSFPKTEKQCALKYLYCLLLCDTIRHDGDIIYKCELVKTRLHVFRPHIRQYNTTAPIK